MENYLKQKRLKENYLRCQDLDLNCLYLLPSRHTLDINATNWKNLLNNNISKLKYKKKKINNSYSEMVVKKKKKWNGHLCLCTKIFNNSNNEIVILAFSLSIINGSLGIKIKKVKMDILDYS